MKQTTDDEILDDVDAVLEQLATSGDYEEAERLKKATSRRFSAFEISNSLLDVIDAGYVVNGHRFGWSFDCEREDFANSQRLDFRDAVLARLKKGGGR